MHRKTFLFLILFIFSCCRNEETPSTRKEKWVFSSGYATTTSCCIAFDKEGKIITDNDANPIFNTLLGWEGDSASETILSLNDGYTFEILLDGHTALQGSMKSNRQHLQLNYYSHGLDLKILHITTDSLIMEAKGYACGIPDVTMTFYRRRE